MSQLAILAMSIVSVALDPIGKIPKKFTKKVGNKVINRQYFRRNTGLKMFQNMNQSTPGLNGF